MYRMFTMTAPLVMFVVVASLQAAETGVTGRVVRLNQSGIPTGMAANARVQVKDQGGQQVADVTADANGLVKIDLPRAGRYFYVVDGRDEGRGFVHTLSAGYAAYSFFIIDHDKPVTEPVFQEVGILRGRVFEESASGDLGIPNALITLRKVGQRSLTQVRTQSADRDGQHAGEYEIELEVGTYHASASAGGFRRRVDPVPIEIVAAPPAVTRDFTLTRSQPPPDLLAEQGIRGTVAVLKNGTTIPPPVPIRIDILKALDQDAVHTTAPGDSRGTFAQATAPGIYRVVALAPDNGYQKAVSPPVFVFPGRYTHVKLVLRPIKPDVEPTTTTFTLEVQVIDREDEHPLADALVRLRRKTQPISEALRANTNSAGIASFASDVPGTYLTLAEAKGYKSAGLSVQAGPGEPNHVRIALTRATTPTAAHLLVTVRDAENGKPLPRAAVLVHREDLSIRDGKRTTTDDKGQAKVAVQPAEFVVLAGASGFRTGRATVRVNRAEETRVDIALVRRELPTPGSVAVTGQVVYEPPAGLAGFALISDATMSWKRTAPTPGLPRTATTNEIGRYHIDLREGTYTVSIKPPNENFLPLTASVIVRRGMRPKDFTLKARTSPPPPPGTLVDVSGFVLARGDGRLRAVPESVVQWRRADGRPPVVQSDRASRMGRYNVRVPAGGYEVTITPPKPFKTLTEKVRVYEGMRSQNFTVESAEDGGTPPAQLVNVTGVVLGIKSPTIRTSPTRRFPIPGAEVVWIRPGQATKATSGKDGRFQVRLPQAEYRVVAKAKGFEELDTKIAVRANMSTVNLVLTAASVEPIRPTKLAVDLRVVEQKLVLNRRRITTPVHDAQILIRQRNQVVAMGRSGRDGRFSATLPPGAYDVKVTRTDYVPQAASISLTTSNVKRDIVMRRSQVTPQPTAKPMLTLRVVASPAITRPGIRAVLTGVPQADVTVIKGSTRVATGKTDGNGNYRTSLDPGTYQIKVSGAAIRPAGTTVQVTTSNVIRQIVVQRATTEGPLNRPLIRPRPTLKKRLN